MRQIIIEDALFEAFPAFSRAVIVVEEIDNHSPSPTIHDLLDSQLKDLAPIALNQDPRILAWDQAHRQFGSNPNRYPPSIKSLLKRLQKRPHLPYINSTVALFNLISLKYVLPCGGDDLDRISGDLALGMARGDEQFIPLGTEQPEAPEPGEVIYFDTGTRSVMCRRWNWRNGDVTKIDRSTRRLVINIDCLPPHDRTTGMVACQELAALLELHCQARLRVSELHAEQRRLPLDG